MAGPARSLLTLVVLVLAGCGNSGENASSTSDGVLEGTVTSGDVETEARSVASDPGLVVDSTLSGRQWTCDDIAGPISETTGFSATAEEMIAELAFSSNYRGGCAITGGDSGISVEVHEANDRHSDPWILIAPANVDAREAVRIDHAALDEAYATEWSSRLAILARRGTTEIVITHVGDVPQEDLVEAAAAILEGVPSGPGATRWDLSDAELAEVERVTGLDLSGDTANEPLLPVPPGATDGEWFCSSIDDWDGDPSCSQEVDPNSAEGYCADLEAAGLQYDAELAQIADSRALCTGVHEGWWYGVGSDMAVALLVDRVNKLVAQLDDAPAAPAIDPDGSGSDRPTSLIGGILFDELIVLGVPANNANCAIESVRGGVDNLDTGSILAGDDAAAMPFVESALGCEIDRATIAALLVSIRGG